MPTIEDIILQKDQRNITALRSHLPEDFATQAAQLVLEHPRKAFIATGFYILSAGAPETDGPPGAVAIGNALSELGYEVGYLTDRFSLSLVHSLARREHPVFDFPVTGHRESAEYAHELVAQENPSVLVSIERAGLVGDGTFRNFRAEDISDYNAKIDHLFDMHPYTVGIGDGGNEIGMGNLRGQMEGLAKLPPDPCVTTATRLMIASTSNWGGYGLVAALSVLSGRNLLPSVEQENQWVHASVEAGAVEGMTGERKPWVDNMPLEDYNDCLRQLHEHVERAIGEGGR